MKRSYSMAELAALFKVHIRTVQVWHKDGMKPGDESVRPLLFQGYEVRRYLKNRVRSGRCRLANDEFKCPRCRRTTKSRDADITFKITGLRMGKSDQQVIVKGICIVCGCRLTRFETTNSIKKLFWWPKFQEAHKELYGSPESSLETDLKEEKKQNEH